jgi:hypothetical protein
MSFFKKIAQMVSPPADSNVYWVYAKCHRCGEKLSARVNMSNDLSIKYGEKEKEDTYFCRKVIMGSGKCFQRIEVELTFDKNRNLLNREIQGGQFIDEVEYSSGLSTEVEN